MGHCGDAGGPSDVRQRAAGLATDESLAPAAAKARAVAGTGDQTVRTRVFDIARRIDWPSPYAGRALQNDFTRRRHGREAELAVEAGEFDRYRGASQSEDFDTAVVWAGEGVDLVTGVLPAQRVVEAFILEAEASIARASALRRGDGGS
jgi:nitronate monooxygenase